MKLLLDPGLLQTFLTERIINALDLKPVGSGNIGISEFLSKKEGEIALKEYELKITSYGQQIYTFIQCVACFEDIPKYSRPKFSLCNSESGVYKRIAACLPQ